jgi:hypothetical protein
MTARACFLSDLVGRLLHDLAGRAVHRVRHGFASSRKWCRAARKCGVRADPGTPGAISVSRFDRARTRIRQIPGSGRQDVVRADRGAVPYQRPHVVDLDVSGSDDRAAQWGEDQASARRQADPVRSPWPADRCRCPRTPPPARRSRVRRGRERRGCATGGYPLPQSPHLPFTADMSNRVPDRSDRKPRGVDCVILARIRTRPRHASGRRNRPDCACRGTDRYRGLSVAWARAMERGYRASVH